MSSYIDDGTAVVRNGDGVLEIGGLAKVPKHPRGCVKGQTDRVIQYLLPLSTYVAKY